MLLSTALPYPPSILMNVTRFVLAFSSRYGVHLIKLLTAKKSDFLGSLHFFVDKEAVAYKATGDTAKKLK